MTCTRRSRWSGTATSGRCARRGRRATTPTTEPPVAGLLLAAGAGTRFGAPKAFVTVDGEPLVRRGLVTLATAGCAPVVVVLGAAAEQAPDLPGAHVVVNPDWSSGMASSLRRGLAALDATDAAACAVLLVDTPGIGPDAVRRLAAAARPDEVAVATYAGRQGHPVVIGRRHWAAVAALAEGDVGARPFLAAHPEVVRRVACDDVASPTDLDTPDDLTAYVGWRHGS